MPNCNAVALWAIGMKRQPFIRSRELYKRTMLTSKIAGQETELCMDEMLATSESLLDLLGDQAIFR